MVISDQEFYWFWAGYGLVALLVVLVGYLMGYSRMWWLRAGTLVIGIALVPLTYKTLEPFLVNRSVAETEQKIALPDYDYKPWHAFPVQVDGRIKPLDTAAIESIRHITGRARFEKQDPVAIVLQWMLFQGPARSEVFDWEHYPFILCEHQDLRKEIYRHRVDNEDELSEDQLHGRYIAPADLRDSPGFRDLLTAATAIRDSDKEKGAQSLSPTQRKAEDVSGRLQLFDGISQFNLGLPSRQHHEDPIHLVALDRAPSAAWFSLTDLQEIKADLQANANKGDANRWTFMMLDRLSHMPQLYISPERKQALEQFQAQIKAGQGQKAIDDLAIILKDRREKRIAAFEELRKQHNIEQAGQLLLEMIKTPEEQKRVFSAMHASSDQTKDPSAPVAPNNQKVMDELRSILEERDQRIIDDLQSRVRSATSGRYQPDNPEFRMLHLNYLENRFPNLYLESAAWQKFPTDDANRVLAGCEKVRQAYRSQDATQFAEASGAFFQTVREVSELVGAYPGQDTIGDRLGGLITGRPVANPSQELISLELAYNHADAFTWAWIVMLASALFFVASSALSSRVAYGLAFATYAVALALELFGFIARMAIAGRPPVSNMYETLIWVSFMSAIFALVLELIYRKNVIGLAGALVSTLALVLAAQLPVELGVKIGPIVPVLRSNYWLTIHVLTIVSSYAAGTLAWGLGNLSLALLAFGQPSRDLLKVLAKYTYRAIQIAVLLLAAGTFLGGWWAAESWGRFWGWDPKEVWALIALVCYVIPLHARFIGWVKDFGLAVSAVVCYAAIVMSWYGVNFVLAAGLHSYGFGSGGPWMAFWAGLLNLEWVLIASMIYLKKTGAPTAVRNPAIPQSEPEYVSV